MSRSLDDRFAALRRLEAPDRVRFAETLPAPRRSPAAPLAAGFAVAIAVALIIVALAPLTRRDPVEVDGPRQSAPADVSLIERTQVLDHGIVGSVSADSDGAWIWREDVPGGILTSIGATGRSESFPTEVEPVWESGSRSIEVVDGSVWLGGIIQRDRSAKAAIEVFDQETNSSRVIDLAGSFVTDLAVAGPSVWAIVEQDSGAVAVELSAEDFSVGRSIPLSFGNVAGAAAIRGEYLVVGGIEYTADSGRSAVYESVQLPSARSVAKSGPELAGTGGPFVIGGDLWLHSVAGFLRVDPGTLAEQAGPAGDDGPCCLLATAPASGYWSVADDGSVVFYDPSTGTAKRFSAGIRGGLMSLAAFDDRLWMLSRSGVLSEFSVS